MTDEKDRLRLIWQAYNNGDPINDMDLEYIIMRLEPCHDTLVELGAEFRHTRMALLNALDMLRTFRRNRNATSQTGSVSPKSDNEDHQVKEGTPVEPDAEQDRASREQVENILDEAMTVMGDALNVYDLSGENDHWVRVKESNPNAQERPVDQMARILDAFLQEHE